MVCKNSTNIYLIHDATGPALLFTSPIALTSISDALYCFSKALFKPRPKWRAVIDGLLRESLKPASRRQGTPNKAMRMSSEWPGTKRGSERSMHDFPLMLGAGFLKGRITDSYAHFLWTTLHITCGVNRKVYSPQ